MCRGFDQVKRYDHRSDSVGWSCTREREQEGKQTTVRGDPGQSPCNLPSKPKHTIFLLWMTCHESAPVMAKAGWQRATRIHPPQKKRINPDIFYIHNHSSTLSHAFITMIQDDTASIECLSTYLLHLTNGQVPDEICYIYSTEPLHLQHRRHA